MTKSLTAHSNMNILSLSEYSESDILTMAVAALCDGKVLIIPTDTVYGLACDITNEDAVRMIYRIKGRDFQKALPVLVSDFTMMSSVAHVSSEIENEIQAYHSITAVLPTRERIPLVARSGKDTVGVRIPSLPFLKKLISHFGGPIAGTSANRSGNSSHWDIQQVIADFSETIYKPDLVIDAGMLPSKDPSAIIDFTVIPHALVRKGSM